MEVEFASETIFVLVAAQLTLGAIFFVVTLARKLGTAATPDRGWRAVMLWMSLATLGLSLVLDALFLFGRPYAPIFSPELANASLLSVGVTLCFALLGKGSGRALLASAAGLLAIWKIPFMLS